MTAKMWLVVDGQEPIPVTHLFDATGEETDDPALADRFVAGPMADGQWMSGTFDEFRFAQVH